MNRFGVGNRYAWRGAATVGCHHDWVVNDKKKEVFCKACGFGFVFRNYMLERYYLSFVNFGKSSSYIKA